MRQEEWKLSDLETEWKKAAERARDRILRTQQDDRLNEKEIKRMLVFEKSTPSKDLVLKLKIPVHLWQGMIDATVNPEDFKNLEKKAEEEKIENLKFHSIPDRGHGVLVPGRSLDPILKGTECPRDPMKDQIMDVISYEIKAANERKKK
jgi:alpha-beta hydrolase superfamily lysophospholipase